MARKTVDLTKSSVAYFDKGVDSPGFYILEGEPSESEVEITDAEQYYGDDGEPAVTETGRMATGASRSTGETIKVKHESNMKPGQQVWPDGEDGFTTQNPESSE